jgi:thioredoxin reductase (NADPH)
MEELLESYFIYGLAIGLCLWAVIAYLRSQKRKSSEVEEKIKVAKQEGLFEPVSLHPVVDEKNCIQTGACIAACPEKDILGIRRGKATTINASHCIGHGACFHACPTQAITLCIGTEKRGVELPHVNHNFETNVSGVFIAGELGGMGLIKNAVEQGQQAVDNLVKSMKKQHGAEYDLIIVGAGPAGIAALLNAKKHGLKCLALEQDTLGGTVFTFPRSKIVMTSPMNLPLHGKVRLFESSKAQLLELWNEVLTKNQLTVKENCKVESVQAKDGNFLVETSLGERFTTHKVLLAIGRRGTPRKLGVPGEVSDKVAYRLLEPENIEGKEIVVVGGGDSAIESALLLAPQNKVILSYRSEAFSRIKPKNLKQVNEAIAEKRIDVRFNTQIVKIEQNTISIASMDGSVSEIPNQLVYVFAGGELPTQFLSKIGIQITKKFGEALLKHE